MKRTRWIASAERVVGAEDVIGGIGWGGCLCDGMGSVSSDHGGRL